MGTDLFSRFSGRCQQEVHHERVTAGLHDLQNPAHVQVHVVVEDAVAQPDDRIPLFEFLR